MSRRRSKSTAGGAHRWARNAQRDCIRGRQIADALEPVAEYRIAGEQIGILVDLFRKRLMNACTRSKKSSGGSIASPPMRM